MSTVSEKVAAVVAAMKPVVAKATKPELTPWEKFGGVKVAVAA